MAAGKDAVEGPFVVGLNHRTTPNDLRSRISAACGDGIAMLPKAAEFGLAELAVLSTCNRVEIYGVGRAEAAIDLLASETGIPAAELQAHLYVKRGPCAACHLFRVASGLDSAVLGETEIVAQVKRTWREAKEAKTSGPFVELVFPRGLEASKRVRSETELCRNVTSPFTLGVRRVEEALGGLAGKRVLVLGAGMVAERILKDLPASSESRILNRTYQRALDLGARYGAIAVEATELESELAAADAVFATLGAPTPLLTRDLLGRVTAQRGGVPLTIVDFGVPTNVEEGAEADLSTLTQLTDACAANLENRLAAVPAAMDILEEELVRYEETLAKRRAAPTIRALIEQGEAVKRRNVEWAKERLGHLDEREIRVVEEMARRMMIGLLQSPIDRLGGELSAQEHRDVAERLFGIGESSDR